MMTRTPSKTIWVGRIGSKRDQPLVNTDALYCRDVGGHRDTKTLTKLNFLAFSEILGQKEPENALGAKKFQLFAK